MIDTLENGMMGTAAPRDNWGQQPLLALAGRSMDSGNLALHVILDQGNAVPAKEDIWLLPLIGAGVEGHAWDGVGR